MIWGTVLKKKEEIVRNIEQKRHCVDMLDALRCDVVIDAYQDTQPGSGSCLFHNYEEQEKYENILNELCDIKLLFPQIQKKDITVINYFFQKIETLSRGPGCFENSELADCMEQAFCFFKYFASHQITQKSIDDFCESGSWIVKNTVTWNEERESFERTALISANMIFMIK